MRNRIAIFGGSGFIGSRLALALLERGVEITVIDLVEPPPDLSTECQFVSCDISDRAALNGLLKDCDVVYLLAAQLAKGCIENPQRGWVTNVLGTANVLDAIITDAPDARVVFSGTGNIYSRTNTYPLKEDAPLLCRGLYAKSKLAGEMMVQSSSHLLPGGAVILRFFTVYGPGPASGQRGHFIATWMERFVQGEPLKVFGDGHQTVDLTHVTDVVAACIAAATLKIGDERFRTYNLGSGTETKVVEIANWIRMHAPDYAVSFHPELGDYAPQRQFADFSKAAHDLGYSPRIAPRDGIFELIRMQRSHSHTVKVSPAVSNGNS